MVAKGSGGYIGPIGPQRTSREERREAARFVVRGGRVSDAARMYGTTERTVLRWVEGIAGEGAAKEAALRGNPDMLHDFDLWLRAELVRRGMTQHELARRAGFSDAMVSKIVGGKTSPFLVTVVRLLDALKEADDGRK